MCVCTDKDVCTFLIVIYLQSKHRCFQAKKIQLTGIKRSMIPYHQKSVK